MTDIDLVYLYVNGNDPNWIAKRNRVIGKPTQGQENCEGRYADHDELKYSLRSVELYAPWLRKIFIVTDDQVPDWLDCSNPKVQIVDHHEIIPSQYLPCFNSVVIEHHLHNIPGLSEHFLYANDDMFINQPVTPGFFFAEDGLPIIRFNRRLFRRLSFWYRATVQGRPLDAYNKTIQNAAALVKERYGIYYSGKTHHNIDSYLKSSYRHARQVFDREITATLGNHVRSASDIQRNLYSYVALAEKKGHLHYVSQRTSFRFHIDNREHYHKFEQYHPVLFCMNDSQFADDDDRQCVTDFLNRHFPTPSQFEKPQSSQRQ